MDLRFDLAAAQAAAAEGRLMEWTLAMILREGRANRPLAALLRGQRAILSGPVLVPVATLERIAGGEPGLKYSVPMPQWEREIAPMLDAEMESLPPILVRYGRHVADGNHRADVWARQGRTHGWAIVWEDSDPRFRDWWTPFLPDVSPTFESRETATGILFSAVSQGRTVGSFELNQEPDGYRLERLWVEPEWRGLRLGSRMLRVARPLMDGRLVRTTAPESLVRFFSETGFVPETAPSGGWVGLRRSGG